ncbi:nucleotide exchange factor GrpE [Pelagibacteraceae bacterium]|nr:nucleotide exchange factor GrpE [Pelagibacteraceae bacterium]
MEKEENLNQDDNTKRSTEDNGSTEKLLKEDQTNINKDEMSSEATPEETEATPEETEATHEETEATHEEKIKELEDKLARTFAEMENQRRRFEKEKDDAFDYGGFTFAKEALNLIDNLERSKLILESDEALKETGALKKTLEHLEIINKDLISIFTKNNIKPIDCLNKKLDPNLHQAMMEIEDDEKEPGTIIQEVQKGFMIKERLLRPSLVGVSKKKVQKDEENKENLDK